MNPTNNLVIEITSDEEADCNKQKNLKKSKSVDYDDCVVLDIDPSEVLLQNPNNNYSGEGNDDSDDVLVVCEKGQVACRDYPHSRHLCVKFPFSTTPNQTHCNQCYCYVCDSLAPCVYWGNGTATTDHCHATDKEDFWILKRKTVKNGSKIAKPVTQPTPPPVHIPNPSLVHANHTPVNFQHPRNNLLTSRNKLHPDSTSQALIRVHRKQNLSFRVHRPVFKRTGAVRVTAPGAVRVTAPGAVRVAPTSAVKVAPTGAVRVAPTGAVKVAPTGAVTVAPVKVAPTGAVRVAPTSAVKVAPTSAVRVAPTGSVKVAPTSAVRVAPTGAVKVAPTGAVRVAPTGAVKVAPTGAVRVAPTGAVKVAPTCAVRVAPTGAVRVAPTDVVKVAPTGAVRVAPTGAVGVAQTGAVGVAQTVAVRVARTVASARRDAARVARRNPVTAARTNAGRVGQTVAVPRTNAARVARIDAVMVTPKAIQNLTGVR